MKSAKIKYQKLADGRIFIKAFEDIATPNKLKESLGEDGAASYMVANRPHFYKNEYRPLLHVHDGNSTMYLRPGMIISKYTFQEIIDNMKKGGERIQNIREFMNSNEVLTVEI